MKSLTMCLVGLMLLSGCKDKQGNFGGTGEPAKAAQAVPVATNGVEIVKGGEGPHKRVTFALAATTKRKVEIAQTLKTFSKGAPGSSMTKQSESTVTMVVSWTATEFVDGKMIYRCEVDDASAISDTPTSQVPESVLQNFETHEAKVTVNPDGSATFENDKNNAVERLLQQFIVIFPDVPIAPGAVWTFDTKMESSPNMWPEGRPVQEISTRAELVSHLGVEAVVKLTRSGTIDNGGIVNNWNSTATVKFDLVDAVPLEATIEATDLMSSSGVSYGKYTYDIDLTTKS